MTLKEFAVNSNASKTTFNDIGTKFNSPIKEAFRPITANLIGKKRASEVSNNSFLRQVLVASSTSRKSSSLSSGKNVSTSNNALFPSLQKTKELNLSLKQVKPSRKNSSLKSSKMDIFNLKTVDQQQVVSFEDVKNDTEKKLAEQADSSLEDDQNLDKISFCSENTVEFIRDAQDYLLEDDNRVINQKLYLSEPKFHRMFAVKSARLPSLKEIEQKRNKSFVSPGLISPG